MQPARLSTSPSDDFVTRRVIRDGALVAVLRTLDHGGAFAVVAELAGDDASCIRPYTFARRDDAAAFFAEVVESFAYLGCEIEPA
jgi:hypothetical protein